MQYMGLSPGAAVAQRLRKQEQSVQKLGSLETSLVESNLVSPGIPFFLKLFLMLKFASLSLAPGDLAGHPKWQLRYGTFLASKSGPAMKGLVGGPQS